MQKYMLTFTRRFVAQNLIDLKIFWQEPELTSGSKWPMGQRKIQREQHKKSLKKAVGISQKIRKKARYKGCNNTTAYAAIPSSRPVNPRRSVVVAFTLICSGCTCKSAAITCTICGISVAIRGACAT